MKVLFVCMGNICRSPTAEGVFKRVAEEHLVHMEIHVDSAGTHTYHRGESPDHRAQVAALRRGVDLSDQISRILMDEDFRNFDFILAMDSDNMDKLLDRCPPEYTERVSLFMDFAPDSNYSEVPDPYFGGPQGFEKVLDLVEAASMGLVRHIQQRTRQ